MTILQRFRVTIIQRLLRIRIPGEVIPIAYFLAPSFVFWYSALNYYHDLFRSSLSASSVGGVEVFDFIVVGGGSSGAVVANRLSRHNRVLLLEAGGDPNPLAYVPVASPILLNRSPIDWRHKTVPQVNSSLGLIDHVARFPRGKGLGGSSVLNSMIYMRGHPRDYDHWAEVTGDSEWSYANLLPYFKKLEDYHGHFPNRSAHGTGGPIHVEKLRFAPGMEYWLNAGQELGYEIRDLNSHQLPSFAPMDVTMKKGTRFDTYRAYLRPLRNRKSLIIYRYSHVIKVHLDRRKQAYGVTYIRHGANHFVRADKEVILSAGSINTPQLLMLSGIGPKKHLNSLQIKCRVNLPVGQNLQDHLFTNFGPVLLNKPVSVLVDRDLSLNSLREFLHNGSGPLVSITGISGAAAISSTHSEDPLWPDILFHFIGAGIHRSLGSDQEKSFGFRPGFLRKLYRPVIGRDANFVLILLARPESSGYIRLRSQNPFVKPLIEPGYLRESKDMDVLIEGIKFLERLYESTTTFRDLGARLSPYPIPACSKYRFRSRAYWECYIRYYSLTLHHQCCTARMGKRQNDPRAVVDSQLRVLKTSRLRVIDMSVFPDIINANPNVPCIMLGERGSDLIRQYWAEQYQVSNMLQFLLREENQKCFYSRLT